MNSLITNWKTSLAGLIVFIAGLLGFIDPKVFTPQVTGAIIAIAGAFGFVAAKDGVSSILGTQGAAIEKAVFPVVDTLTANSSNAIIEEIHKVAEAIIAANNTAIANIPAAPVTPVVSPPSVTQIATPAVAANTTTAPTA